MKQPGLMAVIEQVMLDLGARAQAQATVLKQRFLDGDLDRAAFVELLAAFIVEMNGQGLTAGAAALDDYMGHALDLVEVSTAAPAAVAAADKGLRVASVSKVDSHYLDAARLATAVGTILDTSGAEGQRIERLASSEPMEATQQAYQSAMAGDSRVNGWKRQVDSDPCELCQWWSRDGRIWPPNHEMPKHKGCACIPLPVVAVGKVQAVATQRKRK